MSDERIKKLPAWARNYIRELERAVRDAEDAMADRTTVTDDYYAPGLHFGTSLGNHRIALKDHHGTCDREV